MVPHAPWPLDYGSDTSGDCSNTAAPAPAASSIRNCSLTRKKRSSYGPALSHFLNISGLIRQCLFEVQVAFWLFCRALAQYSMGCGCIHPRGAVLLLGASSRCCKFFLCTSCRRRFVLDVAAPAVAAPRAGHRVSACRSRV